MTRKSFQQGYIFSRWTKRGTVHVIRYRVQRADGTWKHRAETVNSHRKKDAAKLLAERMRGVNGGAKLPSDITFAEFVNHQWEVYVRERLKPSTRATHRSNVNAHLIPEFGGFPLAVVSALQVSNFLEKKRQQGLSPKTRLNLYLLLQKMFNLAIDLELIQASPVRRVLRPKVERKEKPTLSLEEVRKVIDAAPEDMRALFILLYLTGLRIGEALGLKWQDVDFANSELHIQRSVWRGKEQSPKSRRSVRAKHMVDTLSTALKTHKRLSHYTEPASYIFANGAGKPHEPDNLRKRVLYKAMRRAGIKRTIKAAYGFHIFRHSAGSVMHRATGGDLKQMQNFLGHSSIATTGDVYLHLQPDVEVESAKKLEQAAFPDLCSTVLNSGAAADSGMVN